MGKKGWSDVKPGAEGKWEDLLDWYKLKTPKETDFNQIRFVGPIMSTMYHWIEVTKKDGGKGSFPVMCCGYDPDLQITDESKCPACQCGIKQQQIYFSNAIIRELQEMKPANAKSITDFPEEQKKQYREVGDKSWSPIRVLRVTKSGAKQVHDIVKLNRHKIDGSLSCKDVCDNDYGVDLFVKYDPDEVPANMYSFQKGDCSPLTAEEKSYKLYNLEIVKIDPVSVEANLIRTGHMAKEDARYSKAVRQTPSGKGSSAKEEDETLEIEEDVEESGTDAQDHLTALDRDALKKYVVKNGLKDKIRILKSMSDEDLRVQIRQAEGSSEKSCFGSYKAEAECFTCSQRNSCIDKQEA